MDNIGKETMKGIEPQEASGKLLYGLTTSFRNIFKQRISNICRNAFLQYQDRIKPSNKFLYINIDNDEATNEKQFDDLEFEEEWRHVPMFMRKEPLKPPPQSIIESIISGDQGIFNHLYEKEFPAVVRHILANSGTVDDASDIFQDAIVLLIEIAKSKNLAFSDNGIEKYLFEISRRLWYEQLRRKKKTSEEIAEMLLIINGMVLEMEFYPEPDKYNEIKNEIDKLGPRCKEILYQYYFLNRDWKTITEELGYLNEASARNQKFKCLERIRKNLNQKH